MGSISFFFCTLICLSTFAQKIMISGYIKDEASREALIGASVVCTNSKRGTSSNQYGFFSLTISIADKIELIISYQGYKIQAKKIIAKENVQLDVY